ncbi:MarR family transcriptional regulator [Gryllotalpicola sp.]|uniref:MarR family winged helix-turn-helix transcriptional regulator n=1 Tax=Gryllotalpicola sp. TaxID=1932787 RepID=UPI002635DB6F|nr:MarR family transcriptional regulator [Gryllotalpicola sp.]
MRADDERTAPRTASADDDVAARLAVAIGRINRRIRASSDGPSHGASHGVISALSSIVRHGRLRPSELARIEAVAAPTVTRVIADLEARGFVERVPDSEDGRSFWVQATTAGVEAVSQARFERAEYLAALLVELSPAQREALEAALGSLEAAASAGLPTS